MVRTRVVPMMSLGRKPVLPKMLAALKSDLVIQPVVIAKRPRPQTKLYQAPDDSTPQTMKKPTPKRLKNLPKSKKALDKNNNVPKVTGGKVSKGKKSQKTKSASKKGNDRLKKRDGIAIPKENPFFNDSTVPTFVSGNTYYRWLIRAILRKNIGEMRAIFKSKKIWPVDSKKTFSYADYRTAENILYLVGDEKLTEEFIKLKNAIDSKKSIPWEKNLLERKSTGQRNFYMLGRATRAIEMSRGGREGNNALLNYVTNPKYDVDETEMLVMANTDYKEFMRMSQWKYKPFLMRGLETHLVTAVRIGNCELAHAIASAEAKYQTNELHRLTLKIGGKLPQKILGVSVVKKAYNSRNITPFHTAAINPDGAKMLELLRSADPNINIPDQDNWYTVHYAAVNRNPGALQFLFRNGAAPTMLNKKHQSPLHVAAIAGRVETTKAILEAIEKLEKGEGLEGPKPEKSLINSRTREGETALLSAVRNQRVGVVKTLLENKTTLVDAPSSTTTNKLTPLMLACSIGNLEIAQILVEHGALIEGKDKKKRTALSHAVMNGQQHIAAYLLSMGTDLLKGDSSGNTPAHYASAYGWLNCLQLLAKVDPECLSKENDWKITPLTVAFLKGHYGIVSWLLDGEYKDHVDINGKDMEGYTLLSCLLAFSDPDVHDQLPEQIEYLLARGADCSLIDSYDNTILHDFTSLIVKLIKPGATESYKKGMTEKQYRQCFDMLIEKAPEAVTAKNQNLQTPIHLALYQGNLLMYNWMMEKVDMNTFFKEKWSNDENVLHALLALPIIVWNSDRWDDQPSPSPDLYDILPILKKLHAAYPTDFINWLREKNLKHQEPVLSFLNSLTSTNHRGHQNENSQSFMDYIASIVSWICDILPETPTLIVKNPETMSLLAYSCSIPLEDESFILLKTLLSKAVKAGNIESVLLQKPFNDQSIIFYSLNNIACARVLLQFAKENNCTKGVHNAMIKFEGVEEKKKEINRTLLMVLTSMGETNGALDLINELELESADWSAKDSEGNSAWHYAVKSSNHRTLSLMKLLETKKVPRESNNCGLTPLHVAVQACDGSANSVLEPIEWLVTKSNVADQDIYGRTAMHYIFATMNQLNEKKLGETVKDPIAVVSILAMDITEDQLNVVDCDGNTALHLAAAAGANISAVTLLRKGARVDLKNNDGNTPLGLAVMKARQGVTLTLIQANSNVTDKVIEACKKTQVEELWIWNSIKQSEEVVSDSTIPAQIVKRGLDWAAMVYVLLDTLGKNTSSLAQITACALRERQYNLANQLLKSLEALLDGRPLNSEEDLIVIFAEGFKGPQLPVLTAPNDSLSQPAKPISGRDWKFKPILSMSFLNSRMDGGQILPCTSLKGTSFDSTCEAQSNSIVPESVERTVLERLLAVGCPILKDGACPALEIAIFNQAWSLADFLKKQLDSYWKSLKPVNPDEGPMKALLCTENAGGVEFSRWMDIILSLKHLNATTCSMTLPVPKTLNGMATGKFTAMGWAALHGSVDLIYFLRSKGFDVNAQDEMGRTPLMLAIVANDSKAIEALCDVNTAKAVAAKKDKNIVKMKMSLGNHLAFTLNGRKRKVSDSDNDDDEGSENDSDSHSEVSEQSEEEDDNNDGKTPLKKLKITNKKLNLDLKDKQGRNILHYLVEPVAWENVSLLNLFAKENKTLTKKLLLEKDNRGETPAYLAAMKKQRMMTAAMTTISGQNVKIPEAVLPSVTDLICPYDISADSSAFVEKFAKENDQKKTTKIPEDRPHKLTGYAESGVVVKDEKTDQYFKVLLNKSDLSYGRFGFHNFYRMELVKRRDTNLYNVFTNWGRIGAGDGEYQNTPFGNLEAAVKEFCSIFKSKTGQEWVPLDKFVDQPKKYRLVKIDKSPASLAELELPKIKEEKEKDVVRAFVKDISDPEKLKEYQNAIRGNMKIASPFGRVTKEAIETAREILKDCELVAKQIMETMQSKTTSQEKLIRLLNQANDLSSEFYSVVPIGNAEYSALKRFDDENSIQEAQKQLNRMAEVEIAARVLTGAAERQIVERISYIQSAMECRVRAMEPQEEMSQYILQWIHNTKSENPTIKGILEITPRRSVENFTKFVNDTNQMYLLHGTRAVNLLSLLRDGFLVDPQNSQINGRMFGDGIYLADCFGKSHNYCQVSSKGWKYMLVCQVSFGQLAVRDCNQYKEENLKSYDSFHMRGTCYPKCAITIDGVSMPLGPTAERISWRTNYSEFIVKDSQRVLPRFIIMYK